MTDRLHFRLLSVAAGVCLSTLAILYVLAMHRERDRRVVPWEPDGITLAEDAALTGELLGAVDARELDPSRPDIVVVLLGGVREDRISTEVMPNLLDFVTGARSYDDARSVSSWPAPARASVLTGLHPSEHGMHRGRTGLLTALEPDVPVLPEALQEAGYRTAAVVADTRFHHKKTGLDRGWDVLLDRDLEDGDPPLGYARADRVTAMAEQVLSHWDDEPVFLLAEYLDGCTPWVPWDETTQDMFSILPSTLHYPGEGRFAWRSLVSAVMQDKRDLKAPEKKTWSLAYSADLRQLDRELGELFAVLDARSRPTWVFVVGSHGEALGEHDVVGHGWDLFAETVEVPWAIRGPGLESGIDDTPLQLTDLHDQVLAAAGLAAWPEVDPERMRVAESHFAPSRELRLAVGKPYKRIKRSFVRGRHELMLDSKRGVWAYFNGRQDKVVTGPWTEGLEADARAWIATASPDEAASDEASSAEAASDEAPPEVPKIP